jgi:macrolide transport system ATP-binding/permease protein
MTRRRRALQHLDQDLRDHIEQETADNIALGLPPDEARRRALVRFGNVAVTMEDTRAVWSWRWLDELRQDLRYTIRTLARTPGFAVVVILTLALGIGANTAIFSLFNAIMLRTLPLPSSQALQFVAQGGDRFTPGSNYPYFERIRGRTDLFAGATMYTPNNVKVSTGEGFETARAQYAGGSYHAVIGVPIVLGRGFVAEDDRGSTEPRVAVISDGYWARKFGRDPQVLGKTLSINGRSIAIVGVTAAGFEGLDPGSRTDVTLPFSLRALDNHDFLTDHGMWSDSPIVVRLKPGVSPEQASAAMDALFQQFLSEPPNAWLKTIDGWSRVRASLIPANRGTGDLRREYARSLQVLLAMVAVVLLISCANIANLLVARGTARAKEMAVRLSIGASRARLVRQLLTESLLLAAIGGAGAYLLARLGVSAIATMVAAGPNPIQLDLQPDAGVLLFTIVMSVLTGILFGLAPALASTRVSLAPALKTSGAATGPSSASSRRRWGARQLLVAMQMAFCVLLVAGAGLLTRTLRNLETRDGGFDRSRVLLFSLDSRGTGFKADEMPQLCDALIDRLKSRGDVLSGSCSRNIPANARGNARPLDVPGAPERPTNARFVMTNMISPAYFSTLGIHLLAGRAFDEHDTTTAQRVAVINRATARYFFGDANPIGREVHFYRQDERLDVLTAKPMTIVGLVEDTLQRSLRDEQSTRMIYTPLTQLLEPEGMLTVALRTREDPLTLAASVRPAARDLNGNVVVENIRTMDQQIGEMLVRERLLAMLSSAFGALALLLSCIGLYGVVSYDVTRNLRSLGIRVALGAQRGSVLRHVVGKALSVSSIGVVVGMSATLAVTQWLASLLFGITARDPLTLTAAAGLLLLTTLLASYLPARRAARVDPVTVLRME